MAVLPNFSLKYRWAYNDCLANPSPEAAKALLEKLPELLKDDPALAALIAEEMAKEFEGVGEVEHDAWPPMTDEEAEALFDKIMEDNGDE